MPLFAWALIFLVVSTALTMVLTPKPVAPQASALGDFDFPQIDEGTPEMVMFGDGWTDGWMVLWFGNLRSTKVKSKGKK